MKIDLDCVDDKLIRRRLYEESFADFFFDFWNTLSPEKFQEIPWLHRPLCNLLQRLWAKKIDIPGFILSICPRSGKSSMLTLFCVWVVITSRAKAQIIWSGTKLQLCERTSAWVKDILLSKSVQDIWPEIGISRNQSSNEFWVGTWKDQTKSGHFITSSTGSNIIGHGANLIITDDPESVEEANSKLLREKSYRWVKESLFSRANNSGCIRIVSQQRLHPEDVTGQLLRDDPRWLQVRVPIVGDDIKPDPRLEELGFIDPRADGEGLGLMSDEQIKEKEIEAGQFAWWSQWKLLPRIRGGSTGRAEDFKYCDESAVPKATLWARGVDLASTVNRRSDYSASVLVGWHKPSRKLFIKHIFQDKMLPGKLISKIQQMANSDPLAVEYILEGGALSNVYVEQIIQAIPTRKCHVVKPHRDKISRASSVLSLLSNGNVYLVCDEKDGKLVPPPLTDVLIDELIHLDACAHDDVADALSMAANHLISRKSIMMV